MTILPLAPRLASAYAVTRAPHGAVTPYARQRGVCRQWVYREAAWVRDALTRPALQEHLRQQLRVLQARVAYLEQRLGQAVVLDRDKQAQFASVGQALGVSLPELHTLLDVLVPGQAASVATLGRWAQAAGQKAGALLAVLDEHTRPLVTQALADEIYLKRPALMVVEPDSLCWVSGRLVERLDGAAWAEELAALPQLEQLTRDGGSCLGRGVAALNQQRQGQGLSPVADQLDHSHLLRDGGRAVGRAERAAQRAQGALAKALAELARRRRQGQPIAGSLSRVRACQRRAARTLAVWVDHDRLWQQARAAVQPFTPEGELNTRSRAGAALQAVLPGLPAPAFAEVKRSLARPEAVTYLDEVGRKLLALPVPAAVLQAAVRQGGLRRRPEALRGASPSAAALRAVLLVCAVIPTKAGAVGAAAVQGVRLVLHRSGRASSLVECVSSVVRMQQARHRKMRRGLLDPKRLYWNSHVFRTGRRRRQSPYQRLGVVLPPGVDGWDLLHWSPEQLRNELSTLKKPG